MDPNGHQRYPTDGSFPTYYANDRNDPLPISQSMKSDPRSSIGGFIGGSRGGGRDSGRDDMAIDPTHPRKRIAVACGRCRKRKIRCSGDPGDGSGCTNCRAAGVPPGSCQFNRVGSEEPYNLMARHCHVPFGITSGNGTLPFSNVSGRPMQSRNTPATTFNPLDPKPLGYPVWAGPFSEEASSGDPYHLGQPNAYQPNVQGLPSQQMYCGRYGWGFPGTKDLQHDAASPFFDPVSAPSGYAPNGLPYVQTDVKPAVTTQPLSPLNMTALHQNLPEKTAVPQRQLPMPQPNPAQGSRNTVDNMQDQRLRSAQHMGVPSLAMTAVHSRPPMPWETNNDAHASASTESSPTIASGHMSTSAQRTNVPDNAAAYLPATTSVDDHAADISRPTQSHYNFSASTPVENIAIPTANSPYSDFRGSTSRDNHPRASISAEATTTPTQNESNESMYKYSKGTAIKRDPFEDNASTGPLLVSGQTYSPPTQAHPHDAAKPSRRQCEMQRKAEKQPVTSTVSSRL